MSENFKNIGLYIHIPFCDGKCNYCDFYSFKAGDDTLDRYTDTLIKRIILWSEKLGKPKVDTVYFGGGTPSLLGTDRLVRIFDVIQKSFLIVSDCEFTLEANPTTASAVSFDTLKNYGLNRVSLGMQSANDRELELLGRRHSKADVINTVSKIRNSGIDNISIDVMLGIPEQTAESLVNTLDFCIGTGTKHISTYLLSVEPNTPFGINPDKYKFADDDMQAEFYQLTSEYLMSKGFEHYEISNYCKESKFSRHNMRYWQLKDYLGIGPSAHSLIDGKRFYYPRSIDEFTNGTIINDGIGNTQEEYIMLMLRTNIGINFDDYRELFNAELSNRFFSKCRIYEKMGYVKISDKSVRLTEKGFLLSNTIIADLI